MGEGFDRAAVGLNGAKDEGMIIAVNDISFLWGFDTPYHAREALVRFGDAALGLRDERVSKVNDRIDIINSKNVNKGVLLAPDYPLIKALYEIREENMEQFLLILQILTQCGEEEDTGGDEFVIGEYINMYIGRNWDSGNMNSIRNMETECITDAAAAKWISLRRQTNWDKSC